MKSYKIETAFSILLSLSAKFQEIDVEHSSWLKGEHMSRHLYLIEKYNELLKGFIMMRQDPQTFSKFT